MSSKKPAAPAVNENRIETVIWVDPTLVKKRENFNPRIKPFTEDIKPSIIDHGVRESVEAVDNGDGTYTLNAQGHRRLDCLIELKNEKYTTTRVGNKPLMMPLRIVPAPKDQKDLLADILTLNTGKPLEMLETARVYGQMLDGITDKKAQREGAKEINKQTGKSINAIMNYLLLLECGPVITKLLENGQANGSMVIDLFLAGPCKGDWSKVETAVVEAVANAAQAGKKEATKRDVPADKKNTPAAAGEAGEGAAAPEATDAAGEAAKRADADKKAEEREEKKRLEATEKRVMRLSDVAVAIPLPDEAVGFAASLPILVKTIAGYVYPPAYDLLKLEKAADLSDVNVAFKAVNRDVLKELAEAAKVLDLKHKGEIAQLKIAHKAELDKVNVDLTAAQAQVKALQPKK